MLVREESALLLKKTDTVFTGDDTPCLLLAPKGSEKRL